MDRASWVLIVDDDEDSSAILVDVLARAGIDATSAATGTEAIELLEHVARPPAAILTDLVMPGMLGTSLLEYLRSEPRFNAVPVAVMTSAPQLAPPGYRVYAKPFRASEILEFVATA